MLLFAHVFSALMSTKQNINQKLVLKCRETNKIKNDKLATVLTINTLSLSAPFASRDPVSMFTLFCGLTFGNHYLARQSSLPMDVHF